MPIPTRPPTARPEIFTPEVNVEEAVEMRPVVVASPEGPTVNSGTLAEERIWRKFPVCPVAPLRVRRFELVEVEVIVRTVEVAWVVVPMENWERVLSIAKRVAESRVVAPE